MNNDALLAQLNQITGMAAIQNPLRQKFWLTTSEKVNFYLTPDKWYTARADMSVNIDGEDANMVALAFSPGDGTGDDKTFSEGSLFMPQRIMFAHKPWRVYPRKKEVTVEGMIPLFTVLPQHSTYMKFNSTLLELGLKEDGHTIIATNKMRKPIWRWETDGPALLLTVGSNRAGERFWDPHAIYAPQTGHLIQVAAFIATNDTRSKVFRLLENHGKTPDIADAVSF